MGSTVFAKGWIATASHQPAPDAILIIDGRIAYDLARFYGQNRADVAIALANPALRSVGFSAVPIPTAGLAAGQHTAEIAVLSPDGRHFDRTAKAWSFTLY
jgi:hypothetical protein